MENIPTVVQAVPLREIRKDARYLDRTSDTRIVGCTPQYLAMNNLHVAAGRFLTDRDLKQLDNICVLGDVTASTLFPYEDPIGQEHPDRQRFLCRGRSHRQPHGQRQHRRQFLAVRTTTRTFTSRLRRCGLALATR